MEWVAITFSTGSSWPRDQTQISCIVGRHIYCLSHKQGEKITLRMEENNSKWDNW